LLLLKPQCDYTLVTMDKFKLTNALEVLYSNQDDSIFGPGVPSLTKHWIEGSDGKVNVTISGMRDYDAKKLLNICEKLNLHVYVDFEENKDIGWRSFTMNFQQAPFVISEVDIQSGDDTLDGILKSLDACEPDISRERYFENHRIKCPKGITDKELGLLQGHVDVRRVRLGGYFRCVTLQKTIRLSIVRHAIHPKEALRERRRRNPIGKMKTRKINHSIWAIDELTNGPPVEIE
jgi:hypothetical protein